MIVMSEKFGKESFSAETMKEAYLKATRWVAVNVVSKDELKDVLVKYQKSTEKFPTVTVHLYVTIDETEIREEHCKICKEAHSSFFINENFNCSRCNVNSYQRRAEAKIKVKKQFYKEVLQRRE